jgi:SAM-dependent methyltransferase
MSVAAGRNPSFGPSLVDVYDGVLGPLLFEGFAADLAHRVQRQKPKRVLEIAAGTGIATRALARVLLPETDLTGTDISLAMLEKARLNVRSSGIAWRQADAAALPFEDASFDAVACQFGVMFFARRSAAFDEVRRVLSRGSTFVFNVWGGMELNPMPRAIFQALADITPGAGSSCLAAHGYADLNCIRTELAASGLIVQDAAELCLQSALTSSEDAARAFCSGTPISDDLARLPTSRRADALSAVTRALKDAFGRGSWRAPLRATVVIATAA